MESNEKEIKWTPGPWRAVVPAGYGKQTIIMSGTDIIAELVKFNGKHANAYLIAAAPTMAEALQKIVRRAYCDGFESEAELNGYLGTIADYAKQALSSLTPQSNSNEAE